MTKQITLAVSGSISAYKAADLTSQLIKKGYEVTVLMTQAATAFITPLTLQVLSKNPVHLDVMAEHDVKIVNHIELAKVTDLFVLAPASANTIAHLAYGFADNMVTSVALALPETTPKLIAPAMNTNMYLNPITQQNLKRLADLGFREIPPKTALLACGDTGPGALADIDDIVTVISQQLAR
ncbi:phosphopantothenoylcysteine decarboxylase [Streptococcus equi subsp. zooepidemicus]|uniref:phosphopantothenoylcysteine decarboxylase n=1 Tax=Streptococcus equi TaxID=1336 RepID=UPI001E4E8A8F|nr:phosphopantothenoylcysteine decarboxylase [Streptococcus equi]MCD3388753.1 phosphopantothenoylcysteine decarboxylase [Streptococcus equi subsp. zooepidemicus]HEL0623451.1 phosphopantothenoylcysteine decarboxylase [Streptococcus equi subsp. zooepidemicus]HEL0632088.1 phosphopantothenoylcysteine decarboxylase [Streptococcus equi subsp. zooepidemicus]HEL0674810.1 phosphopantothenoylcysteine decarboxylase [Streptococcus equi subsp. zooepidemicus]HEL0683502.1 phosphopantothenoylcysteine decarbox